MADLSPEARRIYDLLMAPTSEEYETRFLAYKKETLDAVRKSARTSAATETAPSPSSSTARLLVPRDTSLAASRAVLSTTGDLSPEAHRIDMHATDLAPPAPTTCLAECPSRDASVSLSVLTPLAAPTATSDSVLELPEYTTKCSFFSPHRSDDLPSSPPLATTMSRPPRPLATTSPAAGITLNYVQATEAHLLMADVLPTNLMCGVLLPPVKPLFLTTEVVHAAAPMVFDPGAVTPASAYTSSQVVVSVQNNGNNNGFSSQKPITCSMLVRDLDADNIRVTAVAHLNKGILMAISTPAEDTTCNMLFRCVSLKCRPLPWPSFEFNQVWIQFWYVYVSEKISGFTSKVMGITSGDDTKFGDGKGWSELYAIDLYHTVKPNACCMPIDTLSEQDLESDCKTIIRCCPNIPDDDLVDIVPFPMLESVVKLVMSLRKMGGAVHTQFLGPLPQAQVYWSHFKMEIVIVSFLPTLGSYCVTHDHYPWVPELLQFHPLLYSWFQFWSTRKASLYGYNASQFQWEFAWPTTTQTHSTPYGMHMYLNPECSTVIYSMKIEVESLSISPVSVMHLHWDPGGFTRYGLRVKEDFTVAEFTSRYFVDVLLCSGLEGQPSTCVVMLQTYRFYPTRISSWKDAMLAVNQWVLMRCIPFVWHSFEMELVLDSYDRMCLTSHFLQRASFLMQWKIPWLFSCLILEDWLLHCSSGRVFLSSSEKGQLEIAGLLNLALIEWEIWTSGVYFWEIFLGASACGPILPMLLWLQFAIDNEEKFYSCIETGKLHDLLGSCMTYPRSIHYLELRILDAKSTRLHTLHATKFYLLLGLHYSYDQFMRETHHSSKALQLPWDLGDCFASAWRQEDFGSEDESCSYSHTDTFQVPWDPGGLSGDRLGGKPILRGEDCQRPIYMGRPMGRHLRPRPTWKLVAEETEAYIRRERLQPGELETERRASAWKARIG